MSTKLLYNKIVYDESNLTINFPDYIHGPNIFENLNSIIITNTENLNYISSTITHRIFGTQNFDIEFINDLVIELIK